MNNYDDLIKEGYKPYENEDIIVLWKPQLCQHAAHCVHGSPEVFNSKRKPWIDLNTGDTKTVVETIDKCPSGALKYIIKGEK